MYLPQQLVKHLACTALWRNSTFILQYQMLYNRSFWQTKIIKNVTLQLQYPLIFASMICNLNLPFDKNFPFKLFYFQKSFLFSVLQEFNSFNCVCHFNHGLICTSSYFLCLTFLLFPTACPPNTLTSSTIFCPLMCHI